jgi:predicted RNA-binding protein YlxR (DUF448 family)
MSPIKSLRQKSETPQRTCIACREKTEKDSLIRLVRTVDEKITIDLNGKLSGRGAYLCKTVSCWETGFLPDMIQKTLKLSDKPSDSDFNLITREARDLIIQSLKSDLGGFKNDSR